MAVEHFNVSEQTIRIISSVTGIVYTLVAKYASARYNNSKATPVAPALSLEDRLKRISEFNEIIDLPEDSGLPDEIVTLITERNYYKLMMERYRNDLAKCRGGELPPLQNPFELLGIHGHQGIPNVIPISPTQSVSEDAAKAAEG